MASGFSLKDQLFNAGKVAYLSGLFAAASSDFDGDAFESAVMSRLSELELKARISWIGQCLDAALPGRLGDVAGVLRAALPPPLDPSRSDDDFGDFIFAPLGDLVVRKGLDAAPDLSLDLIEEITQRFSMEWAIRPYLNRWPDLTLARMADWVGHKSYHVRRLVSEGTRPRLPWGEGISLAMARPLDLLDRLHGDPTRYVTRSVANHLNDITKKDPGLVMDRLEDWAGRGIQSEKELAWMRAHALRGLIKAGDPRAMGLLGYAPDAPVDCRLTLGRERVPIGEALAFDVVLEGAGDIPVLVDYVVQFQSADGRARRKVFKLKQALVTGGQLRLTKRHWFKRDATIFRLYPGVHHLEVQVNGRSRAQAAFELTL